MSRIRALFSVGVLLAVMAGVAGCASPGAYFVDRGHDAADVVTAAVGIGAGAKVRAGPVHTGLVLGLGSLGLRGGELGESGGHGTIDREVLVFSSAEGFERGDERGKNYLAKGSRYLPFLTTRLREGNNPAYFSQVEVMGGLGLTVRLGFNPGELIDFLLGWFGADLYGDDREMLELRDREIASGNAAQIITLALQRRGETLRLPEPPAKIDAEWTILTHCSPRFILVFGKHGPEIDALFEQFFGKENVLRVEPSGPKPPAGWETLVQTPRRQGIRCKHLSRVSEIEFFDDYDLLVRLSQLSRRPESPPRAERVEP